MSKTLIKNHLLKAIKTNPDFSAAHYELAKTFIEQKKYGPAIESLKNAVKCSLNKSNILKKNIEGLIKKREFSQLKHKMYKMQNSKLNSSTYYAEMASLYLSTNDLPNAKKNAVLSLKQYKNQASALYILGKICFKDKKWENAYKWCEEALEVNYKNSNIHLLLAKINLQQNKNENAVHHYKIAKDYNQCIKDEKLEKISNHFPEL